MRLTVVEKGTNMGRWLVGLIALLLIGLLYGLLTGGPRIEAMEADIRNALSADGHDWASVEMSGNVATVSGTAPSADAKAAALRTAETTTCSACNNKHTWHEVRDGVTARQAAAIPAQSPYTFSARKSEDGTIVLDGYVPDAATKTRILADAREIFDGGRIVDRTIRVATGAPDGQWADVIDEHFRELNLLEKGRFQMEDREGILTGEAATLDVRTRINDMVTNDTPAPYSISANIKVPDTASDAVGEVSSQGICQTLLNDLREGKKVFFEQDKAVIKGDENFDLLRDIADAANQCPSFRVAINGYTSAEGREAYNQALSKRRADAVLAFLNGEAGIDRSRLSATGYGEADPIASNDTAEGRERNRRIEFILSRSE